MNTQSAPPSESDPAYLNVMRLLAEQSQLSQRELASSMGISLGKVNYCLQALIRKGFVKAQNYRKSSNKLAYLYLLTPAGVAHKADLTRRFLAIKMKEYEALRQEIELLQRERLDPVATRPARDYSSALRSDES